MASSISMNMPLFWTMMLMVLVNVTVVVVVAADSAEIGHGCSNENLYTSANVTGFKENRDAAFASLRSNLSSSRSGFATSMSNKSRADQVYALVQCRKYLSANECLECCTTAEKSIIEYCPFSNGGRIHLDGCFLRFENTSFFGQGTDQQFSNYCASIYDSNPKEFSQKAQIMLTQLITNASKSDGYAVGSIAVGSESVYALAQCWSTLDNSTCQQCLKDARRILVDDCLYRHEGRALEAGCFMRYATYSFFSDNSDNGGNGTSDSPTSSRKGKSKILPILLGSIGGGSLIAALCVVIIKKCSRERFNTLFLPLAKTEVGLAVRETFDQVIFDYEVLKDATDNFDGRNLVGKGGFGEVYKGRLADGRVIAVKKLRDRRTTQAMDEFLAEVKIISSVRHRNLVHLLGCCTQGHERLLVYEFMANKSLDKHLFGDTETHLDWNTRFNIIVGTARGLAYLHEDSNFRIVHRDIKTGNILLDDKFNPKVADFGLAKFFPEGESHVSTRVGGTIGYTAPEYAVHGQLSEKADVYSYGVVVLEIVSGRKSLNTKLPEPQHLLLQWAWRQYESDQVLDIVDPRLKGKYPREKTLRAIIIALVCTQASPALRPAMSQVLSMLISDSEIRMRPTQPAFINGIANVNASTSKSADSTHSHGSITASLFPR